MMNTGKTWQELGANKVHSHNRPEWTSEGSVGGTEAIRVGKKVCKWTYTKKDVCRILRVSPWSKSSFPVAKNILGNTYGRLGGWYRNKAV